MSTPTPSSRSSTVRMNGKNSASRQVSTKPRIGRLIFHAISAAVMFNGFRALESIPAMKRIKPEVGYFGYAILLLGRAWGVAELWIGMLQYLTILGLIASAVVMGLAGIVDMSPTIRGLRPIKRAILLFALPVEITVASIYWPLILLAPELMIPQELTSGSEPSAVKPDGSLARIPLWIDLSLHAVPALALIFDFFIFEKKYTPPISTRYSPFIAGSFGLSYAGWIEYCASKGKGIFPYPFLTLATGWQRGLIYVVATGFAWAVFRGLNALHR